MLDVETYADDESAAGQYLRIKIQIDIRNPWWRGDTLHVRAQRRSLWCPFTYEFLLDFCYICGILGHVDADSMTGDRKNKKKEFGPWLRVVPQRKKWKED